MGFIHVRWSVFLVSFFLLCLSQACVAGHYSVTYVGGQAKVTDSSGVHTYPYGAGYGGTWTEQSNPTQILCHREVSARFTWQPDSIIDYPPRAVVLLQHCRVTYGGIGSAITGLTPEIDQGHTKVADQYSLVDNPGYYFVVSCSPRVTSASNTSGNNVEVAEASVEYRASTYHVNLDLDGVVNDEGSKYCLIGKRVWASLALFSWNPIDPDLHLVPTWSVGGDVFDYYDTSHGQGDQVTQAFRVDVPGSRWTELDPCWIWNQQGSRTVQCTFDVCLGQTVVASGSISETVHVEEPEYVYDATPASLNRLEGTYVSGKVFSNGNPNVTVDTPVGIKFEGYILKQDRYSDYGFGSGIMVQLCSINQVTWADTIITNGFVLDNSYPYDGIFCPDNSTDVSEDADTPAYGVAFDQYYVEDYFENNLMFIPVPSVDYGDYVPLHRINWSWKAEPGPGLTDVGDGTDVQSSSRCILHPEWTDIFTNFGGNP